MPSEGHNHVADFGSQLSACSFKYFVLKKKTLEITVFEILL